MTRLNLPLVAAMMLALAGCVPPSEVSRGAGAQLYSENCTSCHGASAQGDGPLAAELPVRPADLTRLAAGNDGVFPYARVMEQIHGYPGRFHVMPEFGSLLSGPEISWRAPDGTRLRTPRALLQLAEYLASIQKEI